MKLLDNGMVQLAGSDTCLCQEVIYEYNFARMEQKRCSLGESAASAPRRIGRFVTPTSTLSCSPPGPS